MCKLCENNGPDCIVGVNIQKYKDRYRQGQPIKLQLCFDLETELLLALRNNNIVTAENLPKNPEMLQKLWVDIGLEPKYLEGFEKVLHQTIVRHVARLLEDAENDKVLVPSRSGKTRLVWDSRYDSTFATAQKAKEWLSQSHSSPSPPPPSRSGRSAMPQRPLSRDQSVSSFIAEMRRSRHSRRNSSAGKTTRAPSASSALGSSGRRGEARVSTRTPLTPDALADLNSNSDYSYAAEDDDCDVNYFFFEDGTTPKNEVNEIMYAVFMAMEKEVAGVIELPSEDI